jgi:hypothetical protein
MLYAINSSMVFQPAEVGQRDWLHFQAVQDFFQILQKLTTRTDRKLNQS